MGEKTLVAANYIQDFYKAVNALNDHTSIYINIMLELTSKYGKELKDLEPEVRNAMQTAIQNFRHYANKVMLMYEAIFNVHDKKLAKEVKESYEYIITNFGLDPKKARDFTVAINKAMVSEIMQDLLTTSKEIIDKIYNVK